MVHERHVNSPWVSVYSNCSVTSDIVADVWAELRVQRGLEEESRRTECESVSQAQEIMLAD